MVARPALSVLLLAAALALAGCQSSEERAEAHFRSGLALLEAGDEERALVELRNVFRLNGFHKEARETYAAVLMRQGRTSDAYGHYLRLIEQHPDTAPVRRDLAQIALVRGNWDEVERHGREAVRLSPDDPAVQAIAVALDYRAAALARDTAGQAAAAAAAEVLLADPAILAEQQRPGLPGAAQILRRLLIGHRLSGPDPAAALPVVTAAAEAEPAEFEFQRLRLQLLAQGGDTAAVGAQLRVMRERFPGNDEVKGATIGWLLAQGDTDAAEAFLRAEAGADTASPEGHAAVVQLLQALRGNDAARAEILRLRAANAGTPNADLYGAMLASLDFDEGRRTEAVAAMEAILAEAAPSEQTRRLKLSLARMLEATGNPVGARARIEEVLAEDRAQVDALKMRAAWRIQADDPGGAIIDLRAALDQAPRDPAILTLMAEAHERDGALDLAAERLALAVEISGRGAEESLRYAAFLMRDGRIPAALAVLNDARQASPADPRLLNALGRLHLSQQDWPRAEEIAAALAALPGPETRTAAQEIRAAILLGQDRLDESLSVLAGLVNSLTEAGDTTQADKELRAVAMIVETQVRTGRLDAARAYLEERLAERPGDRRLKLLQAGLHAVAGETAEAEAAYRALIAEDALDEAPVRLLYALLVAQDRREDAVALIEKALVSQPGSQLLRWMRAGHQEQAGDIEGAIATYETLYAEDSSNVIVANNLASLITTFRDDPESLARAEAVARRLRGSTVPAFADTYGWIAFRRGDLDTALSHLQRAAEGLPGNALVQYHLGMAYEAAGRTDEARRQFARALDLAGPNPALPQMADAAGRLAALGGPLPAAAP